PKPRSRTGGTPQKWVLNISSNKLRIHTPRTNARAIGTLPVSRREALKAQDTGGRFPTSKRMHRVGRGARHDRPSQGRVILAGSTPFTPPPGKTCCDRHRQLRSPAAHRWADA